MKARWTRMLLIAVLFLALPPGATIAACLQPGAESCCCATACPEPGEASIDSGSCCKMLGGTPLPATKTVTALPVTTKPVDDSIEQNNVVDGPVSRVTRSREVVPARGAPDPVPLFTLHAALLI